MEHQLTPEEFRILLKGMKASFPADWFVPNEESASIWYRHLWDIPYNILSLGVSKLIMTAKKPPTVAEVREAAKEFMPTEECLGCLGEQESWALVRKAVANSNYHAKKEFDKLPAVVQKAVGCPQNLAEWAMMDIDTFESVQQSQFLRAFRAAEARQHEVSLLSAPLRERLLEARGEALNAIGQAKALTKEESDGNT